MRKRTWPILIAALALGLTISTSSRTAHAIAVNPFQPSASAEVGGQPVTLPLVVTCDAVSGLCGFHLSGPVQTSGFIIQSLSGSTKADPMVSYAIAVTNLGPAPTTFEF